jgi:pimeloyl-ACP methyl ester carboxylesterase
MTTDLVVVLPGIMGSTLAEKNGRLVWAPSAGSVIRAVRTIGDSIRDLTLPGGIGDEHPGDGVRPVALMPDLHVLPGVWTPIQGYTVLVKRLTGLGYQPVSDDVAAPPGNLLVVPYDWRLSNRYNGRRLKTLVEPALERWRARGGQYRDAKISFVCHSMGGLVARWYITHEGGADITRKLITIGTPYRGAVRAVDQLFTGVTKDIGPLRVDLTNFARSLPSLYQLLPSYACVERDQHTVSELGFLADTPTLPMLDMQRVTDAAAFHTAMEKAEESLPMSGIRHAITGIRQTTASTLRIAGSNIEVLNSYAGNDTSGDGTVPATSGPKGIALDDPVLKRIADKHGALQCNHAVLDEVVGVLTAKPIVPKAGERMALRVDVPELLLAGEQLPVTVKVPGRDAVKITVIPEAGLPKIRTPRPVGGFAATTFTDLPPGAYTVDVTGLHPGAPIAPVSSTVLIWPTS